VTAVAATAAAAVVGAVVGVAAVGRDAPEHVVPERDEAGFVIDVQNSIDARIHRRARGGARPYPHLVSRGVLVAEGDRACAWLARRPRPQGPAQGWDASIERFLRDVPPPDGWPFGNLRESPPPPRDWWGFGNTVRGEVVTLAWSYLCAGVQQRQIWVGHAAD
jgi:hypothetical protein